VISEGGSSTDWYNTYLNDFIVDMPDASQWAW